MRKNRAIGHAGLLTPYLLYSLLNKIQENIYFAVIRMGMKFYLKVITPIFMFALVYSFLGVLFGPRGFFALRQLRRQQEALLSHVRLLSDIGENLNIRIANLSSDPQTIAVYAHELGYIHKDEKLIKLMNFSGTAEHTEDAGVAYLIEAPRFLSDNVCKTIAVFVGVMVILCEMIVSSKNAYSKGKS